MAEIDVNKITDEQWKQIDGVCDDVLAMASTEVDDEKRLFESTKLLYKQIDLTLEQCFLVDSPPKCAEKAYELGIVEPDDPPQTAILYWRWWWAACCIASVDVLGQPKDELYDISKALLDVHCLLAYETIGIVAQKPKLYFKKVDGENGRIQTVLHRDGGKAIEYKDGWGVYVMNDVEVPEWLAMTPWNELDPARFVELDNAEIRREFVRKVGVDRLIHCKSMDAKLLDKTSDGVYELYDLDLKGETGRVPVLKMLNPSLDGVYHCEFIDPSWFNDHPQTVQSAINFRASRLVSLSPDQDWKPSDLT